jgi:putative endonuclease
MSSGGPSEWSVYILRCRDGTFYTGIAKDVKARFDAHRAGRGAAYTKTHPPIQIAYAERGFTRSEALRRELSIKGLTRQKKQSLVKSGRGFWREQIAKPSRVRRVKNLGPSVRQ